MPVVDENAQPVWHLFVVRVSDRDAFQQKLKAEGIATGVHYPIPLHLQPAYEYLDIPLGSLPVTEQVSREVVSLPMYPELTEEQLAKVAGSIATASVAA
jgi:dTDP-4-amino-4,6-dideoxygalactose transaminase